MEELIKQSFLHVDRIGPHVMEGHYDLIGPNGEIILPQVWDTVIEPDWSISMHMWPLPDVTEARPKPDSKDGEEVVFIEEQSPPRRNFAKPVPFSGFVRREAEQVPAVLDPSLPVKAKGSKRPTSSRTGASSPASTLVGSEKDEDFICQSKESMPESSEQRSTTANDTHFTGKGQRQRRRRYQGKRPKETNNC
jgi:hypothetical protein